jgi:toxin YoeB
MRLVFSTHAWEDYLQWQNTNPQIPSRLNDLIKECQRTPFTGTGKPEPLRGDLKDWWSRRVTLEDRLVYRVSGTRSAQRLVVAQCSWHY